MKPLSEFIRGKLRNFDVAAIIVSGVLVLNRYLISIAIILISGNKPIITQSLRRSCNAILSVEESLFQPNNAISDNTETITFPSRNGSVISFPS